MAYLGRNEISIITSLQESIYDIFRENDFISNSIRDYEVPRRSDSVFLVEVIEHLHRQDGEAILEKLKRIPLVCIATPAKFNDCSCLARFTGNEA